MSASFLQTIERVKKDLPGVFGVCAERLPRGETSTARETPTARLAWNEDRVFPAASVIKIAVALEVLCAIDAGTLDASALLELREDDKVIGSGVLAALGAGLRLPISDVLYLSMSISDNTAANLLVDRVGVASVNARLAGLGLTTTRLRGKIFVPGDAGDGELSPSTPAELVTLMRRIYRRDGLPAAVCEKLLALLARTQTASTIGRGLPDERFPGVGTAPAAITLAYKTGSLAGVVAEAAVVETPHATYAVAVMSEGSGDARPNHDNVGRVMLGAISRAVYDTFG